jgi:hypothetical protein
MPVSGSDIVDTAREALGTPYVWGGNSLSSGVDCSGLVQQVYAAHGIELPRVTYDQINVGSSVPINKLRVGDLVFFDTDRSSKGPDHVGIYIGGGKFIHAPKPGDNVKISSLGDSYYQDRWMGGRRVSGVQTSAGGGGVSEAPAPILDDTELAERYGMSVAFFNSIPELESLFEQAVDGQWTTQRFAASLKQTDWWKENSKSVREMQVLAATDPASYRASIEAQRALLRDAAVQMGAILTERQLDKLARDSLAYQWNEVQIQNFLGRYIDFRKDGTLGGQAGTAANEITSLAYNNGVRISEQTVKNYAQYVVRGVSTMQEVENNIREQAIGAFPGFQDQINAGATVREIATPYIQMMAETLEMPDSDLDLNTNLVRQALNSKNSKGAPAPMSLSDFQVQLRSDPRWRETNQARETAMSMGRQVLADMGLIPSVQEA